MGTLLKNYAYSVWIAFHRSAESRKKPQLEEQFLRLLSYEFSQSIQK